jgi:Rrf2 family iron-sulfur cluster assembly transcriptional regulator
VAYAVGILLQVHKAGLDGPVTAARVSRGCKFPPRYLYRVLRRLVDAGLLLGLSGPQGGYRLAKGPGQIRLLDIVLAVEEPDRGASLEPVQHAQRPAIKLVNELCDRSLAVFHRRLAAVSLAKLAEACATGSLAAPGRPASAGQHRRGGR